jgi:hypothetical protein
MRALVEGWAESGGEKVAPSEVVFDVSREADVRCGSVSSEDENKEEKIVSWGDRTLGSFETFVESDDESVVEIDIGSLTTSWEHDSQRLSLASTDSLLMDASVMLFPDRLKTAELSQAWLDEAVDNPSSFRAAPPDVFCCDISARPRYLYPKSIMEGWVWKRSRFLKQWRRRFLALSPSVLSSFRAAGDEKPTETIRAIGFQDVFSCDDVEGTEGAFTIATTMRTFHIVCDSVQCKEAWIRAISEGLGYQHLRRRTVGNTLRSSLARPY